MAIRWDVDNIVELGGGALNLANALIELSGSAPPRATISQWKFRGTLPSRWAPAVVLLAVRRGARFEDLVVVEQNTLASEAGETDDDDMVDMFADAAS